ncbi:hypothetical protein Tco_0546041 [Tanacetum coccineum]
MIGGWGGGGDGEDTLERFSRGVIGDSDRVISNERILWRGVGEEEVVVGDGVERFSLSLVKSTNSCFGGMIVSLIFLNPWEKEACVSMEV